MQAHTQERRCGGLCPAGAVSQVLAEGSALCHGACVQRWSQRRSRWLLPLTVETWGFVEHGSTLCQDLGRPSCEVQRRGGRAINQWGRRDPVPSVVVTHAVVSARGGHAWSPQEPLQRRQVSARKGKAVWTRGGHEVA